MSKGAAREGQGTAAPLNQNVLERFESAEKKKRTKKSRTRKKKVKNSQKKLKKSRTYAEKLIFLSQNVNEITRKIKKREYLHSKYLNDMETYFSHISGNAHIFIIRSGV